MNVLKPEIGNPNSIVHCKRCGAELACSFGAGIVIANVCIFGKVELVCTGCNWGNQFYPAPPAQKVLERKLEIV